ncbi:MAG: diguanylate cyclase domain-containing protein [Rectinemataceae bacterium]
MGRKPATGPDNEVGATGKASDTELPFAAIDRSNDAIWELTLSDPASALARAEANLEATLRMDYRKGIAESRLNLGWCTYYLSHAEEAIEFFRLALGDFETIDDSVGRMKAHNALGVCHHDLGRYDMAMDHYTRSLEEARAHGNLVREAVSLNNIGEICLERGDIKEGLDWFLRAYEALGNTADSEVVANVLVNIGTSFLSLDNRVLARDFASKALAITKAAGDLNREAEAELVLGRVSVAENLDEDATQHFTRVLELTETLKSGRWRVWAFLELGALDMKRGDLESALRSCNEAAAGAERFGSKTLLHEVSGRLASIHEASGNWRTALAFHRSYLGYERELLGEDTSRKIKNVTVRYEMEKSRQEAEIYRLRNTELKEKGEALEELNRQLLSISEIGQAITSSLDLDTVISTLRANLERHMDTAVFGIAVYVEDEDSLDWKAYFEKGRRIHRPLKKLDGERNIAAWCIAERKPAFINDLEAELRLYISGEPSGHGRLSSSLIFIPLSIDERVIGLMTVQSYGKGAYTQGQLTLLEALGPYVAIAIENSAIHDRLAALNHTILGEKAELEMAASQTSHLANHDSLTGLPNRRLLFDLIQKSISEAAKSGMKVGILFMDLDDFKPINDRFGHLAGDQVLILVAERLRSCMRATDTVARVGGDEFVIVLNGVRDEADLRGTIEKLAEVVRQPMVMQGSECRVGISVGIALYPDQGSSTEELLGVADSAMYGSKEGKKARFRTETGKSRDKQQRR